MQRIRQVDTVAPIREIVDELLNSIVVGVCGGVSGRVNALESVGICPLAPAPVSLWIATATATATTALSPRLVSC